jgi:hypothetical protein
MLGTDVVMVKPPCLVHSEFDNPLRPGGKPDLTANAFFTSPNNILYSTAHLVQFHAKASKHLGSYTLSLTNQTEQYMLGSDIVMIETLSFLLG